MAAVDVIVSAFATPPRESDRLLAQDPSFFVNPPIVIGVDPIMKPGEMLASAGFARAAEQLKAQDASGSILKPLLRRLKGYDIKSVTLIGFSAGNTFLRKVLGGPDAEWIDGIVCLDGLIVQKLWNGSYYEPDLQAWGDFAIHAAQDRKLFLNAFTGIASPSSQVTSTKEGAEAVMDYVQDRVQGTVPLINYDLSKLTEAPPPPAVTITVNRPTASGNVPISRTWETMPAPAVTAIGNAYNLSYGGNNEADHVFMSRYVQRAVWRTFLAKRFNEGIHCASASVSGLGALMGLGEGASCYPNRKLVNSSIYPTDSPWQPLLAAGGGLAAGIFFGYWFGRWI